MEASKLVKIIEAAGSDDTKVFGGGWTGGWRIQQDPQELADLVAALLLHMRARDNYLGIGIAAGGTERFICEMLGMKAITVLDLGAHPHFSTWHQHNRPALEANNVKVTERIGDSHAPGASLFLAEQAKQFDIVGIDGDHSPAGVRMDWMLVQPYIGTGSLVWFHDIACTGAGQTGGLELWQKLSKQYRVVFETKRKFGIGVIQI